MKYTSKLESTVCDLNNCSKCKNLEMCKNDVYGHVYYPKNFNEIIESLNNFTLDLPSLLL